MDTGINGTQGDISSVKMNIEALEFKLADALSSENKNGEKLYRFQLNQARKGLARLQSPDFMEI